MKLELQRTMLLPDRTLGELWVEENGYPRRKFCDTLERKNRDYNKNGKFDGGDDIKVKGDTAIPYGTYKVDYTMSPKFGRFLPILLDVPEFEGVRIHPANDIVDLAGCIGVGKSNGKGQITNSRVTSDDLNDLIHRKITIGEEVTIEIV